MNNVFNASGKVCLLYLKYSCYVEFWSPKKCGSVKPVTLLKKNRVKVFVHISYSGTFRFPIRQGIRIIRYMKVFFFQRMFTCIFTHILSVSVLSSFQ